MIPMAAAFSSVRGEARKAQALLGAPRAGERIIALFAISSGLPPSGRTAISVEEGRARTRFRPIRTAPSQRRSGTNERNGWPQCRRP